MEPVILLVEDDEHDVLFLKNAFDKTGITNPLHVAAHGQEALDYFRGRGKFSNRETYPLPCFVLLDLKLPYVTGLDVLRGIRTQDQSSTIVIVFTSSNSQDDIDNAFRSGANAYLVKPNDPMELLAIAKAIRDFWLCHNQFPCNGQMADNHDRDDDPG